MGSPEFVANLIIYQTDWYLHEHHANHANESGPRPPRADWNRRDDRLHRFILVAAVASAVIIQTGEKLQQNAQATGQDTTDSLAGRINILGVSIKTVAATGADFGANAGDAVKLTLTFKTGAGSDEIREDQIRIVITCDGRGTDNDAGIIVYQGIDLADLEGAVTGTSVAGSALTNASTGDNNVMVAGAVYTTELS